LFYGEAKYICSNVIYIKKKTTGVCLDQRIVTANTIEYRQTCIFEWIVK
jgi:hypothetical protein